MVTADLNWRIIIDNDFDVGEIFAKNSFFCFFVEFVGVGGVGAGGRFVGGDVGGGFDGVDVGGGFVETFCKTSLRDKTSRDKTSRDETLLRQRCSRDNS